MFGLPLMFSVPLVLTALAALPAIWLLLRVTPPQPKRVDFPPLKILADLLPQKETPARTPWWLLLLRLVLAALIILAAAGPILNPILSGRGSGPLLMLVDNGATSAHDWRERQALAMERMEAAGREGRVVALIPLAVKPVAIEPESPASAIETLRSLKPQPHLADRQAHLASVGAFLQSTPEAEILWISDGTGGPEQQAFVTGLAALASNRDVTVLKAERAPAIAIAGVENGGGPLNVRVIRAEANGRNNGTIRATDLKGLPLADVSYAFDGNAIETQVRLELPIEMRNVIARIEVLGEGSAAAVHVVDESSKRRRVGLVFGGTVDRSQPLLSPTFYIERALGPYADVREARGSVADAVTQLIDQQVSMLVLADVGSLDTAAHAKVMEFVGNGGLLLRFAGSRMSSGNDDLVPVRLRRGGRNLGGALSWDAPKTFAPFTRESPFFGLPVPTEIGVRRQMLAEPDGDLASRTWASLQDGTPIVTADKRGEGLIVLFHVTGDTTWSNLPLSGLFVDMLRRVTALSGAPGDLGAQGRETDARAVAPRLTLDGFGAFGSPPSTARPVTRDYAQRADMEHPPGFYGPVDGALAVNTLVAGDTLTALDYAPLSATIAPLAGAKTVDLRTPLLTAALILFLIDTLVSIWLGGKVGELLRRYGRAGATTSLILTALLTIAPGDARAQQQPLPPITANTIDPALVTRLAYVITGNAQVDETSRAGLAGLTQMLAMRTSLQPGDPVGVNLARDELAFYPILYWPIVAGQATPPEAAIRRLDGFMKNGGTVIFDTRDAFGMRPGGTGSAEAQTLQRMLTSVDVPQLEPIPPDHVLTKTFYLLDSFPGRYATGQTWIEALPPASREEAGLPTRSGDGVSPIIITSNDLAAAWAIGPRGESLYPIVGSDTRQREMAFRGGINIVMYALTGNYKSDQVHVPDLLQRLGQ
jgi:hypothetical protein